MDTTATKINALLDAISQDIAKHENVANSAMQTLEKLNATPEEFKEANLRYGLNAFVINYLNRIKAVVMERDIKKAENLIRYHAYYQYSKGNLDDGSTISVAQAAVAETLGGYVARFFEA